MTAILHIAQDNLLAGTANTDYLGTGITITPGQQTPGREPFSRRVLFAARWITGKYDWLVLPVLNFTWHADPTVLRRQFRRILGLLKWRPFGRRSVFQLINPRTTRVCVLDRFDTTEVFEDFADAVGANVYFKTNFREDANTKFQDRSWELAFLPLWIAPERYPLPATEKEFDVFYAAAPVSAQRRAAREEVEQLRSRGLRVCSPENRLDFKAFATAMSKSWLTVSPEGHGYHCFRHSEAMLMESVPVINRPAAPLVTDLSDQKNCVLYDAAVPGDLGRVVEATLADKQRLSIWTKELRRYALENYSASAVGNRILAHLNKPGSNATN